MSRITLTLTKEERAVLDNLRNGRSPWHGWDARHPAMTREGQAAYTARATAIRNCRHLGLITIEGQLAPEAAL